jgi:hypothetical protein
MTRTFAGEFGSVTGACVTTTVSPATVSVAVRLKVPVFAAIV